MRTNSPLAIDVVKEKRAYRRTPSTSTGLAPAQAISTVTPEAKGPMKSSSHEEGSRLRVLVVDDERLSRETAIRQLHEAGFGAEAVENGYRALEALGSNTWDVVLCDLRMPGVDGIELLKLIKQDHPGVDVIMMTAYGSVETAVSAIKDGAADYLTKPFRFQQLEHRLNKLAELRGFRQEVETLRALLDSGSEKTCGIVGCSTVMREVVEKLKTFAQHSTPVLITGETGSGKEIVSRALHELGPRSRQPFVPIACGAIPTELAESEILGHEKGAFTGAIGQRAGALERAHGGTVLLDDIDDLPLGLQVKLLRALEEKSFLRVGGTREIAVDVRIVATTKSSLDGIVAAGRFRSDLYYRLRGLELRLPPLRERGEDILLLAEHFLRKFTAGTGKTLAFTPEAAACLRKYPWPGNVRELRHAIESTAIVCRRDVVTADCLPEFLQAGQSTASESVFSIDLAGREKISFNDILASFEDQLIQWAMQRAHGQQSYAAELLSLPRTTLQSKLVKTSGNGNSKPGANGRKENGSDGGQPPPPSAHT